MHVDLHYIFKQSDVNVFLLTSISILLHSFHWNIKHFATEADADSIKIDKNGSQPDIICLIGYPCCFTEAEIIILPPNSISLALTNGYVFLQACAKLLLCI